MELTRSKTERGFPTVTFKDRYEAKCILQKSSLAFEQAIWLGIVDVEPKVLDKQHGWVDVPIHEDVSINARMHLTQAQVKDLLPILQKFAETGEI